MRKGSFQASIQEKVCIFVGIKSCLFSLKFLTSTSRSTKGRQETDLYDWFKHLLTVPDPLRPLMWGLRQDWQVGRRN